MPRYRHRSGRCRDLRSIPRGSLAPDVRCGVHALPEFLSEAPKLEGRERFWCFERVAEQVRDFLSDRASLAFRACLQLPIQSIRQILDVQGGQMRFLRLSSILPPYIVRVKVRATVRRLGQAPWAG